MGNTISSLSANARVFMILEDWLPENSYEHPKKSLYFLESYLDLNITHDRENGGGSATISFNDKDFRYWKYFPWKFINVKEWGDDRPLRNSTPSLADLVKQETPPVSKALLNTEEINNYRNEILKKYGAKHPAIKALSVLAKEETLTSDGTTPPNGGLLLPVMSPQNILFIDLLAPDGRWYRSFTGIVSSLTIKDSKTQTPVFTVNAKTPDRFFEYSYSVTGTENVGGAWTAEYRYLRTEKQSEKVTALLNRYGGLNTSQVIATALEDCNKFFLRKDIFQPTEISANKGTSGAPTNPSVDFRYFKVDRIFGWGKKLLNDATALTGTPTDGTTNQTIKVSKLDFEGYKLTDNIFRKKSWRFDEQLNVAKDFYPAKDVYSKTGFVSSDSSSDAEWLQVAMDNEYHVKTKPFQNLVRTSIALFQTEKMTIKEVLEQVKKTSLFCIYFDGDNILRIERPYFDIHLGMPREELPPDYDERYIVSKVDKSYISHTYSENEAPIVTRLQIDAKFDWVPNLEAEISTLAFSGKTESSPKTIGKFGDRYVTLNSIISNKFGKIGSSSVIEVLDSYCFAQKLMLSSQSKTFTLELDQRPDLQLNRNILFLDLGLYGLTKSISHTFNPQSNRIITSVTCDYVRPVGYTLYNPWRKILKENDTKNFTLQNWKDIPEIDLTDKKEVGYLEGDTKTGGFFEVNGYDTATEVLKRIYERANKDFKEEDPHLLIVRQKDLTEQKQEGSEVNIENFEDEVIFVMKTDTENIFLKAIGCNGADPQDNEPVVDLYKDQFKEYARIADAVSGGIYNYKLEGLEKDGFKDEAIEGLVCNDFLYDVVDKKMATLRSSLSAKEFKSLTRINGQKGLISAIVHKQPFLYSNYDPDKNIVVKDEAVSSEVGYDTVHVIIPDTDFLDKVKTNLKNSSVDVVFTYNIEVQQKKEESGIKDEIHNISNINFNNSQSIFGDFNSSKGTTKIVYLLNLIQNSNFRNQYTTNEKGLYVWNKEPVFTEDVFKSLGSNQQLLGVANISKDKYGSIPETQKSLIAGGYNKSSQLDWLNNNYSPKVIELFSTNLGLHSNPNISFKDLYAIMSNINISGDGKTLIYPDLEDKKLPRNYPLGASNLNFTFGTGGEKNLNSWAGVSSLIHLGLQASIDPTTIDNISNISSKSNFVLYFLGLYYQFIDGQGNQTVLADKILEASQNIGKSIIVSGFDQDRYSKRISDLTSDKFLNATIGDMTLTDIMLLMTIMNFNDITNLG